MEIKNFFAQDLQGNVIPNPSVALYLAASNTLAPGLKKPDGSDLSNPFDGGLQGQISLQAPDGEYDMRVTGAGRDFTLRVRFIDVSSVYTAITAAKDRANHTGTQGADTITETSTIKMLTAAERVKLAGIQAGATANSSDAQLLARANHTGAQGISTVSGLQDALDSKADRALSNVDAPAGRQNLGVGSAGTRADSYFIRATDPDRFKIVPDRGFAEYCANGVIKQWGVKTGPFNEGEVTIDWPVGFQLSMDFFSATPINSSSSDTANTFVQIKNWNAQGCTVYVQVVNGGGINGFFWECIGR